MIYKSKRREQYVRVQGFVPDASGNGKDPESIRQGGLASGGAVPQYQRGSCRGRGGHPGTQGYGMK